MDFMHKKTKNCKIPQQMGMVVEEVVHFFHSGHTTSILSSFRVHTPTPMPMSMRTTTSVSTTTSTRYQLPGTQIARPNPAIISQIITVIITIITQIITTIIVTIIIIITITTITITRFRSIMNSPEIYIIETPVSVCKVIFLNCSEEKNIYFWKKRERFVSRNEVIVGIFSKAPPFLRKSSEPHKHFCRIFVGSFVRFEFNSKVVKEDEWGSFLYLIFGISQKISSLWGFIRRPFLWIIKFPTKKVSW